MAGAVVWEQRDSGWGLIFGERQVAAPQFRFQVCRMACFCWCNVGGIPTGTDAARCAPILLIRGVLGLCLLLMVVVEGLSKQTYTSAQFILQSSALSSNLLYLFLEGADRHLPP